VLQAEVADAVWQARQAEAVDLSQYHHGMGRELFAAFRANALGAEEGAVTFNAPELQGTGFSAQAVPIHDRFVFANGAAT
jgi:phosphogluconate dehydratase